MKEEVIALKSIAKRYGEKTVVEYINLEVYKGEIFGILGPNGAGKSTTLNIMCGLILPDAGEIKLFGTNSLPIPKKLKPKIGVVPQQLALYMDLKAWENVQLFAGLYGLRGEALKEAVNEALEWTGLIENRNEYVKTFSEGMKRRLNIACAIAHHPDLLIFDEPTVAIDPQSRHFIFEKIEDLKQQGKTIIYTSHYIEEVENLCERIAIMDHGKIIAMGTKNELETLVAEPEEELSLEEIYLRLTGKKQREAIKE